MKCTNKKIGLTALCVVSFSFMLLSGCQKSSIPKPYDMSASVRYGISEDTSQIKANSFAEKLCIIGTEDIPADNINISLAEAAGLFNLNDQQVLYAKNVHEKLYPASTTKVLTALVALEMGNLSDVVTVGNNAMITESGATLCGIQTGDKLTLEQLLNGLLIVSGNDAGVAIAEHLSGSVEEFSKRMNETAKRIGATESHFLNPHGLHNKDHYTTAYDLYLIFQEAMKYDKFREMINTKDYSSSYSSADGTVKPMLWKNTNQYLTDKVKTPAQVTVIGGKTGTTLAAGSCLILLSQNANSAPFVSVIMKSQDKTTLYSEMSSLLDHINDSAVK